MREKLWEIIKEVQEDKGKSIDSVCKECSYAHETN